MDVTVNIRDYILPTEDSSTEETSEKSKTATKPKVKPKATYTLMFASGTDFILNRKTARTDQSLAIIVSQKQYYIKDERTGEITKFRVEPNRIYNEDATILGKFMADNIPESPGYASPEGLDWLPEFPRCKTDCENFLGFLAHTEGILKYGLLAYNCAENWIAVYNYTALGKWLEYMKTYFPIIKELRTLYSGLSLQKFSDTTTRIRYSYIEDSDSTSLRELANSLQFLHYLKTNYGLENMRDFIQTYKELPVFPRLPDTYRLPKVEKSLSNVEYKAFRNYCLYEAVSQGYASEGIFDEWLDTLDMQMLVYKKIKEKYPKNLSSMHRQLSYIVARNREAYDAERWAKIKEEAVKYEWGEGKPVKYIVKFPKDKAALLDEATQQSNCVAGYFNKVLERKCVVVLLRQKKNPDESWVTVEIRGNDIVQAKMRWNRPLTAEARDALMQYANGAELNIANGV